MFDLVTKADVAELVDARDLKSLDGNVVWVRVPPPAPDRMDFQKRFKKDFVGTIRAPASPLALWTSEGSPAIWTAADDYFTRAFQN